MKRIVKFTFTSREFCDTCKDLLSDGIKIVDSEDSTYEKKYCMGCSRNVILRILKNLKDKKK